MRDHVDHIMMDMYPHDYIYLRSFLSIFHNNPIYSCYLFWYCLCEENNNQVLESESWQWSWGKILLPRF